MKKIIFLSISFFVSYGFCNDKDLLYLAAGFNDVKKHNTTTEFRAEYKFHQKLKVMKPIIGFSITTKTQIYAYGGFSLDFVFKHLALAPNFAAGYYNKGHGKDLGCPLEFRSGIEAAVVFNNQMRCGVHFSHTSNASIGRKNPGLETLAFFIAFPI
jgi:lipid A 3-O-deacylase